MLRDDCGEGGKLLIGLTYLTDMNTNWSLSMKKSLKNQKKKKIVRVCENLSPGEKNALLCFAYDRIFGESKEIRDFNKLYSLLASNCISFYEKGKIS